MLHLTDVRFRYGIDSFALHVPELRVEKGQAVALVGPSGSGKTTLLHLVAGIRTPAAGSIRVADVEIPTLSERARRTFRVSRVGLVFQEFELLEYLSVRDNILLPYRIDPTLRLVPEVRARAESLAAELGIEDKLERFPESLSHGERQRAAVCRALVTAPALLLADEPTANLDPANKDRVVETLLRIVAQSSTTLLLVTHDHALLPHFARVLDAADFQDRRESIR